MGCKHCHKTEPLSNLNKLLEPLIIYSGCPFLRQDRISQARPEFLPQAWKSPQSRRNPTRIADDIWGFFWTPTRTKFHPVQISWVTTQNARVRPVLQTACLNIDQQKIYWAGAEDVCLDRTGQKAIDCCCYRSQPAHPLLLHRCLVLGTLFAPVHNVYFVQYDVPVTCIFFDPVSDTIRRRGEYRGIFGEEGVDPGVYYISYIETLLVWTIIYGVILMTLAIICPTQNSIAKVIHFALFQPLLYSTACFTM